MCACGHGACMSSVTACTRRVCETRQKCGNVAFVGASSEHRATRGSIVPVFVVHHCATRGIHPCFEDVARLRPLLLLLHGVRRSFLRVRRRSLQGARSRGCAHGGKSHRRIHKVRSDDVRIRYTYSYSAHEPAQSGSVCTEREPLLRFVSLACWMRPPNVSRFDVRR